MDNAEFTREILDALSAAFPDDEIEFLPRAQANGKALGLAYIDARTVMRRLDAVVGPANWSYDFDVLSPDGKLVRGKLTVCGVTKCDAGEAAQEDEPLKSAVSDALKRAAVHFGIGRYLYYLPRVWAPYDAQKRRFIEQPKLDPAAVRHALQICGIAPPAASRAGATGGQAARPKPDAASGARPAGAPATAGAEAAPAAAPSSPSSPPSGNEERKSIWAAGGNQSGRPAPESSGDRKAQADALTCSADGCGAKLTKGQHDVSLRAFSRPLCPYCQKQARTAE